MTAKPEASSAPDSLTARIVTAHGLAIVDGSLRPGDVIDREDLPEDARAVSRNVWREAVRTLTTLGMLRAVKRKGTVVQPETEWVILHPLVLGWITASSSAAKVIPQLQGFREIIEPAAAHAAAQHRTSAQLDAIETAFQDLAQLATADSEDPDLDVRFHLAIVEATGNRLFQSLKPTIEQVLRLSLSVTLSEPAAERRQALEWHRQVVQAIARRDREAAHAAMLATLTSTYRPWASSGGQKRRGSHSQGSGQNVMSISRTKSNT